ncbi:hypothetical protein WA026_016718 [Henosepilachna vigintioctopunctata]|uniref:Uncharacterized protein n=1 Tax=Henosepilachna vigintioctopunctata TaxID=420089 RepID=A0AAW1UZ40_9CUCU
MSFVSGPSFRSPDKLLYIVNIPFYSPIEMNSKASKICISVLACLGIIILFAILAVVWTQFYQGSFRGSPFRSKNEKRFDVPINYTVSAQVGEAKMKTRLKDLHLPKQVHVYPRQTLQLNPFRPRLNICYVHIYLAENSEAIQVTALRYDNIRLLSTKHHSHFLEIKNDFNLKGHMHRFINA